MRTDLTLDFGDGQYTFRLTMAGIVALEGKCGPIGEVYARTLAGRYSVGGDPLQARFSYADCAEIIRLALIGGKGGEADGKAVEVNAAVANRLIKTYVSPDAGNPLSAAWNLAATILFACVEGYQSEDAAPAPAEKKTTKRAGSASVK